MNDQKKRDRPITPYVFLGSAFLLAISAGVIWFIKPGVESSLDSPSTQLPASDAFSDVAPESSQKIPPSADDVVPPAVDEQENGLTFANPEELLDRLATALEANDQAAIRSLLGKNHSDPATQKILDQIAQMKPKWKNDNRFREVGEIEQNRRARWMLELEDPVNGSREILIDIIKDGLGWRIDKASIAEEAVDSSDSAAMDALAVADAFLQNVLKQNFQEARRFVDGNRVSDATIAGLCILFEEGDYRLRGSRPLRALFSRGDTASYLVNVDAADGSQAAQFGINLRQTSNDVPWLVTEINLDELLADYAKRVAGGDIHYSPFVRNPEGGDTIALYFDFDDDDLGHRAIRQLSIIAAVLKSDVQRKIILSGHTDALGTVGYNDELSERRARVVRDFLAKAGVDPVQIELRAKGARQPRRPNVTESGADDPHGRRANRRTEVYLDF